MSLFKYASYIVSFLITWGNVKFRSSKWINEKKYCDRINFDGRRDLEHLHTLSTNWFKSLKVHFKINLEPIRNTFKNEYLIVVGELDQLWWKVLFDGMIDKMSGLRPLTKDQQSNLYKISGNYVPLDSMNYLFEQLRFHY